MPNTGIDAFVAYAKASKAGELEGKEAPDWVSKNWSESCLCPTWCSLTLSRYVTQSLDLEVKRLLEPGKVRWLFCRAQTKEIVNGRSDMEVLVLDPDMNLIAIGHQIIIVKSLEWAKKGAKVPASSNGPNSGVSSPRI